MTNVLGHRIYYDERDARGVALRKAAGDVNPHSLELWKKATLLQPWSVVVDVGSNYGEMIVDVDYPKSTDIIAFEPNSAILPYLERTLGEYPHEVELIRSAVSDIVQADVLFARDDSWSGKSSLITEERVDTASDVMVFDTVKVTTLDSELGGRGYRDACIKIDVEGAEVSVLRGGAGLLKSLESWAVMLEILHMPTRVVAELVREHFFYLLDKRTGNLIRIHTANPKVLKDVLSSTWIYRQDALLTSHSVVAL